MTDRLIETFTAPTEHRVDALLQRSDLLGERAQTVYAACAGTMHLKGDIAECGVADGQTARGLCQLVGAMAPHKRVHLFDVFDIEPLAARNNLAATAVQTHARPQSAVAQVIGDAYGQYVDWYPGLFWKTLPLLTALLAFVHADGDLYESTCDIITMVNQRVVAGGVVVFDDYGTEWTGVTRAVDERLGQNWRTYAVAGVGQLVAVKQA